MRNPRWNEPQWSPPLKGGSTSLAAQPVVAGNGAAMEPAAEGREHLTLACGKCLYDVPQWSPPLKGGSTLNHVARYGGILAAAMEPAAEGREHAYIGAAGAGNVQSPQWSPPLKGGSTARKIRAV